MVAKKVRKEWEV